MCPCPRRPLAAALWPSPSTALPRCAATNGESGAVWITPGVRSVPEPSSSPASSPFHRPSRCGAAVATLSHHGTPSCCDTSEQRPLSDVGGSPTHPPTHLPIHPPTKRSGPSTTLTCARSCTTAPCPSCTTPLTSAVVLPLRSSCTSATSCPPLSGTRWGRGVWTDRPPFGRVPQSAQQQVQDRLIKHYRCNCRLNDNSKGIGVRPLLHSHLLVRGQSVNCYHA